MEAHAATSEPGLGGRGAMGRRGGSAADEAGRAELERLGRSAARREADRARAVLWALEGETSPAIAARLGVRAEQQVRRWRAAFRRGGVEALRSRPRPGRTPRKREAALAVAGELLKGGAADRPVWTLARLAAEVAARTGETISPGHLSVVLREGATAGAGHGTRSRHGRTRTPSTTPACGSGCWSSKPRPATSTSCSGTRPRRSRTLTSPTPGPRAGPTSGSRRQGRRSGARSSARSTTPDEG